MRTTSKQIPFYQTYGALLPERPSYVTRKADAEIFEALGDGEFCYVLTTRQMGKTSLLVRTAARLRAARDTVVVIDLSAGDLDASSPELWYAGMLDLIAEQLDMQNALAEMPPSSTDRSGVALLFHTVRAVLLPALEQRQPGSRLVIFIDEIDQVLSLPFSADPFFAGIRALYNQRATESLARSLTFCLLGVATPSDLIQDVRTTPFNIGRRIDLNDFTLEEAAPLLRGLTAPDGESLRREDNEASRLDTRAQGTEDRRRPFEGNRLAATRDQQLLSRILYWTGGHPNLTQKFCEALAKRTSEAGAPPSNRDIDDLCETLFLCRNARNSESNLAFVRDRVLYTAETKSAEGSKRMPRPDEEIAGLLHLYAKARKTPGGTEFDETDPLAVTLRLAGIVRVWNDRLIVRNPIYAYVFDAAWIADNLPGVEKRRHAEARRKGRLQAALIYVPIILALAFLTGLSIYFRHSAETSTRNAEAQTGRANALLYVSDMNLIQQNWDQNQPDSERTRELLDETSSLKDAAGMELRGFEWDFWNRQNRSFFGTLAGHTDSIYAVGFSPDGRRIVTGGGDKTVKVWDAATGQVVRTLTGHTDRVNSVAFSPDGRHIVTGSDDHTAKVWDAVTGQSTLTLVGHAGSVLSVAFSPDGGNIVTGSDDYTAKVWDAGTGREILTLTGHGDRVTSVAFSPDGRHIATGSWDKTAKLWNAATGSETLTLKGHGDHVTSVAFSPDGRRIVTGSGDRTAKVWNAVNGRATLNLKGHSDLISSVAFSPAGRRILTGSQDNTAKVWDSGTGHEMFTLKGHTLSVTSVAFSPDGRRIITGSQDDTAKVWYTGMGPEIVTLKGHSGAVLSVAFSPDGTRIVTGSWDDTARVWDAHTGRVTLTLKGHAHAVFAIAFSPDGRRIVTGSGDKTAKVWDAQTGRETLTLMGHSGDVLSVAFSPDGRHIATGSEDRTAKVWDAVAGTETLMLKGHADRVTSIAFSPDGKRIVTGSWDKTAKVWDAGTGAETLTLKGNAERVTSVAFSPDGKRIVTGSWDNTAKVWDAGTDRETLTLKGHSDFVYCAAFSPDGRRIVTGSQDNTAKVWEGGSK